MVAEVIPIPDWRADRDRLRVSRRNALLRAMHVPPEHQGDFERLKQQLQQLAFLPPSVGVSEQTAAIVGDWHRRVPGHDAVPMYLWQ